MKSLYKENTANYPRIKTDVLFADYSNQYSYRGCVDEAFRFAEDEQLLDVELWERFVKQFRENADDHDAGWRGEYWGKMMRGACFVYSYTQNKKLYSILCDTVNEMIKSADNMGRISTYSIACEFDGWDMWSRKYVLLGMQYFMEICTDEELNSKIVSSMEKQVDYIIGKIGRKEDGKKPINSATRHWRGLNASSILEPIVRLYSITKRDKYLEFAKYIVDCGGADVFNIFEAAYKNELKPYQYPVTKAYEMTSCFEGLLEYYRITGVEWYKEAVINFADSILENDFTVIGCCGCTSEYFDHSTVRQANTTNEKIMQETCVTVTLMKFMYQLNLLTGKVKYADAFEISFYNAYLGSLNTEKAVGRSHEYALYDNIIKEALPYDSYAPLTRGSRGNEIGGMRLMSDNHHYGCCACIASLGVGLVAKMHILSSESGFVMNMYVDGEVKTFTPNGENVTFKTQTQYPKDKHIKISIELEKETEFELKIRNPYWSEDTKVSAGDAEIEIKEGYICVFKKWKNTDCVEIDFDMRTKAIYPISYGSQILVNKPVWGYNYMVTTYDKEDPMAKKHIALMRGPVMLAQDSRFGYDLAKPAHIKTNENGYVDVLVDEDTQMPYKSIVKMQVPTENGEYVTLTDYASAGKLWSEENEIAVWMLNK